jgi:GNAT superfamily N-acetyltransferase
MKDFIQLKNYCQAAWRTSGSTLLLSTSCWGQGTPCSYTSLCDFDTTNFIVTTNIPRELSLNVLREFSLPEVIAANEENIAGAFGSLYSDWEEALSHVEEDAVWGLTRISSPMINNASRVRFPEDRADDAIDAIIKEANAHQVSMRWWLGPGTQPPDTGERLKKRGFSHVQLAGMAIELAGMQAPSVEPDLRIERVRDSGQLEAWCRELAAGFSVLQSAADAFGRAFESIGLDSPDWSLYLAYLDGESVATSSMYLGSGVAGIYNVATLPEARGKGAGSAVSYAPLKAAYQAGYQIGILQASRMGYSVYRRLGFEEICTFNLYVL